MARFLNGSQARILARYAHIILFDADLLEISLSRLKLSAWSKLSILRGQEFDLPPPDAAITHASLFAGAPLFAGDAAY